ncbi:MAG: glycosyltransferase family 1 protein [Acidobacteria bacterium]|nr:glycosyltransferase family 1 protein [Acidobacteriota bacterium]
MSEAGLVARLNHQTTTQSFLAKVVSKLRLVRNLRRSSAGPVFVAFMGFTESKTLPFSCWTEILPYCFDCWPATYDRWTSFFARHRVRLAFFSARQSAGYFRQKLPAMRSVWLAEATEPFEYDPSIPLGQREIDVLELGRKNDVFHNRVAAFLASRKKVHHFERTKGQIIFPNRQELIRGLAQTKISVCFPCSQTHPERSGAVETVTHRYFESMASKCLILGHAPAELIDLFGYNPVIEVEEGAEFEQIDFVLNNFGAFHALIQRNYRRLLEVGTWTQRVPVVLNAVQELFRSREAVTEQPTVADSDSPIHQFQRRSPQWQR